MIFETAAGCHPSNADDFCGEGVQTMLKYNKAGSLAVVAVLWAAPVLAQEPSSSQPLNIPASQVKWIDLGGPQLGTGSYYVQKGTADHVTKCIGDKDCLIYISQSKAFDFIPSAK